MLNTGKRVFGYWRCVTTKRAAGWWYFMVHEFGFYELRIPSKERSDV
ncbi:MAG: hypothetical protein BWX80_02755 [Candidatus Hydrogenedentes bacterium ADurb.Bin101]|nr:MAG: hypothetical protein BWX80_02755 [Candidatus Hydrogenedentes bacterium ADurb.Bin101]